MSEAQGLDNLCKLVTARLGLDIQDSWRARLDAFSRKTQTPPAIDRIDALTSQLETLGLDSDLWQQVAAQVTIGETRFLRQRSWFHQIAQLAIIPLINMRRAEGIRRLRFWSAGCATGEEPYTLAILMRELLPDFDDWQITILATDIRADALREAERGEYDRRQLRELDDRQIARFFAAGASSRLKIASDIQRLVTFRTMNLADAATHPTDKGERGFDLIICRNVLMYMIPEVQRKIADHLADMLANRGWLAVSPAEASADWFRSLAPVNAPEAILFTKTPPTRPGPALRQPVADIVSALPRRHAPDARPAAKIAAASSGERVSVSELRSLADRRMLAEARSRCDDLLAADRLNCDASLLLAEICMELDDLPSACDAARHAVYLAPSSAMAHYLLAGALGRMGRTERARKTMRAALELANAAPAEAVVTTGSDITHLQIRNAASAFLKGDIPKPEGAPHGRIQ